MKGVTLTKEKTIIHSQGNLFHAMKKSSEGYRGFGEVYFSTVNKGEVKGWKRHQRMTLNLVVPVGRVAFMLRSDIGEVKRVELGPLNYYRLTVLPGIWVAFEGMENFNLLMNMSDLEHDPEEVDRKDLEAYPLLG
jgi:dTDP-4-dehydrorhamnose 3,5-epimerase